MFCEEPGLEDTLAILRGLKEKYEVHHGVRIRDEALVSAARLASRYFMERKRPDSAIDLVDEAAARLRLQQESKPEPIWRAERELGVKRIELEALRRERDAGSAQRREQLETEAEELETRIGELTAAWQRERAVLEEAKSATEQLDAARGELELAQRRGNWERAAELIHDKIPRLEREAATVVEAAGGGEGKEAAAGSKLAPDSVDAEHVAEVVAAATGIPLGSLLLGSGSGCCSLSRRLGRA